jgi:glycerol-3-phosphate dehydrogenase
MERYDLIIIGGGIHGVGAACDAAGRGLKVGLFEKGDLGAQTSNASTKLIHGGLRYLESWEFSLVRHALQEQDILMRNARYLVEPLPFIIPIEPRIRPKWLVGTGITLYDLLRPTGLPRSRILRSHELRGLGLAEHPEAAFCYYDCQTDDHRLVISEALLAKQLGAAIFPRHTVTSVVSTPLGWAVQAQSLSGTQTVLARSIMLLAGPWSCELWDKWQLPFPRPKMSFIQGSHLIVPKLYEGQHALAYQNDDQRLIFFVPYQQKYTLVGTTDLVITQIPQQPIITMAEQEYLLNVCRKAFNSTLSSSTIKHCFAGIRSLGPSETPGAKSSRDYAIYEHYCPHGHPFLSLSGGKLTTWRYVSEKLVDRLAKHFPRIGSPWTKNKILPGAIIGASATEIFLQLSSDYPLLPAGLLRRLARNYGIRSYELLGSAQHSSQLGALIAGDLYEQEVSFLINHEWAHDMTDILMRRTRLGWQWSQQQIQAAHLWLSGHKHPDLVPLTY